MKHLKSILLLFLGVFFICSCKDKNNIEEYQMNEIKEYAKSIGISDNQLYFINPELQSEYYELGQPNSIVLNRNNARLLAGTCYEEYPFYIDKFYEFKSQLNDTLQMYDLDFKANLSEVLNTIYNSDLIKVDSAKKYYHIYYFAKYAESFDKKKLKDGIEKYKDSVQYFFVNVDKISDLE